jgi:hypothetical protein
LFDLGVSSLHNIQMYINICEATRSGFPKAFGRLYLFFF